MSRELATVRADDVVESAVESLVIKGDVSGLTGPQKTEYYLYLCKSLGLNPATQPFVLVKFQGKEVYYVRREAADQLAARHRVTREITVGPEVRVIEGTKLAYAVCRATHPNGRSEVSVATLPFVDPATILMKCESKAKRRATLSLLGLGQLDEDQVLADAALPAHQPAAPAGGGRRKSTLQDVRDDLQVCGADLSVEQAGAIYADHAPDLSVEDQATAFTLLGQACPKGTTKAALKRAIEAARARPRPDPEDDGPRGGKALPEPAVVLDVDADPDPERDAIRRESADPQARLRAAIETARGCNSSQHLVRHCAAHVAELPPALRAAYRQACAEYGARRYPTALGSTERALREIAAAEARRESQEAA